MKKIGLSFLFLGQRADATQQHDVDDGNQNAAADDGDAPKCLHGGVHRLALREVNLLAVHVHPRHCLHCHRIGDNILQHIADRRQQRRRDVPGAGGRNSTHHVGLAEQQDHDAEADGNHAGTDEYQYALPAPHQVDQMTERHLQRPRQHRPETERGEEFGGKPEAFLDVEGADDAGQSGNAGGRIDHQRRQVRQAHLAPEREDVEIDPAPDCGQWAVRHCLLLRCHIVSCVGTVRLSGLCRLCLGFRLLRRIGGSPDWDRRSRRAWISYRQRPAPRPACASDTRASAGR